MSPIRIRLAALGQLPPDFNRTELLTWKSSVFKTSPVIETFNLNANSEGGNWEYTDDQFDDFLNETFEEDLLVILTNVPLQDNWYLRPLSNNRLVLSFYEIAEILRSKNIPLKNVILKVLYGVTLIYRRCGNKIPPVEEARIHMHDETRRCLYDMTASKGDIIFSCHEPIVCEGCVSALKQHHVSNEHIDAVQKEIFRIKKPLFNRFAEFVKRHPIWSLILSLGTALVIGTVSSFFGSILFSLLLRGT